ncbi:MAG: NADH-quinone oxidoreductase subunit G [Actinomycetota bacterium]
MSAEGKLVTLTIDGEEVSVPAGTLIIRAAESIGKYIPRFCDHPLLDPLGACRQCLVEVEGQRKPLTACTTPVADAMVVKTQATSDLAREGQDGILEFLLINHPLDCPMCDKGGECPLQDQTLAYGPGGSRYIDPKRRFTKPVPINSLIKLDRERCVLCARCTRFSDQIAGDPFIELFERSALEQVAIFEDDAYDSIFGGNIVQICPVGALTSSTFRFRARPFDMESAESTCNRCASGCRITPETRRGELVRILAKEDGSVNDEWICDKGRFGWPYVNHPDRVVEPLVRKEGEFVAVSWAEALQLVADKIVAAREGGKASAVIAGQNLVDEDAYALSRFARTVLGTNDVDARRLLGEEDADAVLAALPATATATNEDIDAAKVILCVGVDLHEESPIVFLRVRKAARKGAAVREIGPRRTTAKVHGARWTACRAGGEAAALAGLARALEIRGNTGIDPSTRAATQGIDPSDEISELAAALQGAHGSVVVLAGERLAATPGALGLAWNIAAAIGGKFGWIPRAGGARGASWAGLHPTLLPGGRSVSDEDGRAAFGSAWGIDPPAARGRNAREIFANAANLGVLYLVGADPEADFEAPDAAARALDAAPFVVAQDLFLTESTKHADVVLPAAALYERAGTVTNWEGRAQPVRAAVPPAGLAQADFEIFAQLAAAAGVRFPQTIEALRKEMTALAVSPGRARPVTVGSAGRPPAGLVLSTYRMLLGEGSMMAGADALAHSAPPLVVEVNPRDASAFSDGDTVVVSADGAEVRAPVRVTESVSPGVVFVPGHQGFAGRNGASCTIEKVEA